MNREELLKKIQYYKIKVDKPTKEFIKTRLVEISHRVDTHINGNEHRVYSFKETIPYGKRAYKGSGVYKAYIAVLDAMASAKERANEARVEVRDIKANPDAYASDELLERLFA